MKTHLGIREIVADLARQMLEKQLTDGTSGNISVIDRELGLIAITPSSIPYIGMTADQITVIDGNGEKIWGEYKPSSEKAMHLSCYQAREDCSVVMHTHSRYAVALSCVHRALPAITVDMAAYCGVEAPVVPYKTPGSQELAQAVGAELSKGTKSLLLANHGALVIAPDGDIAINAAEALELNAMAFIRGSIVGEPVPFSAEEVKKLLALVYGEEKKAV